MESTMRIDNESEKKSWRGLARSEDGAVMIMGLMMILGLIGLLWFLLGIGSTIAFRDHMQDGADAAAFTDAALNANGMNQLAKLNLVIMSLVCIYLAMSFAVTAFWGVTIFGCIFSGGTACVPLLRAYAKVYDARGYFALAVRATELLVVLQELEIGTSTPNMASTTATEVAATYGQNVTGFAYGADNTPNEGLAENEHEYKDAAIDAVGQAGDIAGKVLGESENAAEHAAEHAVEGAKPKAGNLGSILNGAVTGISSALLTAASPPIGQRLGLPVEFEKTGNVCSHIVTYIEGELTSLLGKAASYLKYILPTGMLFASRVNETETFFQYYYCDDSPFGGTGELPDAVKTAAHIVGITERELVGGGDEAGYWNEAGPTRMWKHSDHGGDGNHHKAEPKNGDDYLQFYGFITANTYDDNDAVHKINLAQRKFGGGDQPKPGTYFAQAEMFFSCTDKWSTDACDDEGDDDTIDMVMYQERWEARLVRFHTPTDAGVAQNITETLETASNVATAINPLTQGLTGNPQTVSRGVEDAKAIIGQSTLQGDNNEPPPRTYH